MKLRCMNEYMYALDFFLKMVVVILFQANKGLLVPTPRLRTGLFNKIMPPENANKELLQKCSTALVSCFLIIRNLTSPYTFQSA